MVGHEAVAENSDTVTRGMPAQEVEIETALSGGVEDLLAVVSTLGNVMGDAWNNDTRAAGHRVREVGNALASSRENASDPFFVTLRQSFSVTTLPSAALMCVLAKIQWSAY